MARIRTIKPDFFTSEDVGELTVMSRLLYVALWCHADREGKMKFQRTSLAAQCMPFEMGQFIECLTELHENGLVLPYIVDGKKYLYIPTFTEHQRPHNTEKPSGIPEFNGDVTVKELLEKRKSPTGIGKGKGKGKGSVSENKFSADDLAFASLMEKQIDDLGIGAKPPNLNSWANEVRLTRERDKRTHEDMRRVFQWANNNDFWSRNILSPAKLRKQWPKLVADMKYTPRKDEGENYVIT